MPTPLGGHEGELHLAATAGDALTIISGVQDATYTPGQNFADAHGMDAAHGYQVPVKSTPQITSSRIFDKAATIVFKALANTEATIVSLFAFYPFGANAGLGTAARATGINGTCYVETDSQNSLSDALKNALTIRPAQPDWARFGDWNP